MQVVEAFLRQCQWQESLSLWALDKNTALSSLPLWFLEWVHFDFLWWYSYAIDKRFVMFSFFYLLWNIWEHKKNNIKKKRIPLQHEHCFLTWWVSSNWVSLLATWERSWTFIHPEEISLFSTSLEEMFLFSFPTKNYQLCLFAL